MKKEFKFEVIRTIVAVLISFLIAFALIFCISNQPIETIKSFVLGPFSSGRHIGNIVEMAIPLIFSGLSLLVVFQANLFNLGAEGIFFFSGVIATYVAINFTMPAVAHPMVAILAGGLVGAAIAFIPGFLKAKWNASELVTSLMFNSIFLGIGLYIVNYHLRDTSALAVVSEKLPDTARLGTIISGTRIHMGLVIALAMVLLTYLFLYKTKWGYALRMTGLNRKFAEYSGINTVMIIILAHLISGFIAGVGGATEILGMHRRFSWTALPGYGFDGALVAMLAKNNPVGVIGSALFLAYIRVGADMMARMSDIPSEMVAIIQAIIILLISAERFLQMWKNRQLLKEARQNG